MTTTANAVVETLEALDVEYAFGYPGGRLIEVLEHLPASDVTFVRPRDEREASVMAEMYGRLTGQPGVLMGQGPWIGSLGLLGQLEASLGSSPMVVLTESSERGEYSTLAPYQQARGDYGGISLPKILDGVTREWWSPRTPVETLRSVQLAFKHAVAGRSGPTAVIFDGDAITADVPEESTPPLWGAREQARTWESSPLQADVERAADALAAADRPVVLAGNGVHAARAYDELAAVADAYDCVVTTSYLGKSTYPETAPRAAGVVGSFGHEGANRVVSEANTLLVVGCRLNPMDTNWQAPGFIRPDEQTIVHADIDARNTGWVYPADIGLVGDAAASLTALAEAGEGTSDWSSVDSADATAPDLAGEVYESTDRARNAREWFDTAACTSDATPIKPQRAVAEIEAVLDEDTIVTADSGNNRFWLLNYLQTPAVRTYFGSGGVGAMGWATPAAVSAALVTDQNVIAVTGDGGFAMTMTSVETAVEYGVAPTVVVLNDTSLGMVRQMQDDHAIAGVEFHDTDFVKIVEGFGAVGRQVTDPDGLADAFREGKEADVPHVIDVRIDREEDMADQLASSFYESVGGLHE